MLISIIIHAHLNLEYTIIYTSFSLSLKAFICKFNHMLLNQASDLPKFLNCKNFLIYFCPLVLASIDYFCLNQLLLAYVII